MGLEWFHRYSQGTGRAEKVWLSGWQFEMLMNFSEWKEVVLLYCSTIPCANKDLPSQRSDLPDTGLYFSSKRGGTDICSNSKAQKRQNIAANPVHGRGSSHSWMHLPWKNVNVWMCTSHLQEPESLPSSVTSEHTSSMHSDIYSICPLVAAQPKWTTEKGFPPLSS